MSCCPLNMTARCCKQSTPKRQPPRKSCAFLSSRLRSLNSLLTTCLALLARFHSFMAGVRRAPAHAMQCLRKNARHSKTFIGLEMSRTPVQCRRAAYVYFHWVHIQGTQTTPGPSILHIATYAFSSFREVTFHFCVIPTPMMEGSTKFFLSLRGLWIRLSSFSSNIEKWSWCRQPTSQVVHPSFCFHRNECNSHLHFFPFQPQLLK